MYTLFFLLIIFAVLYSYEAISFERIIGIHPNTETTTTELRKYQIEMINPVTSSYKCGMFCFRQNCKVFSFNPNQKDCTMYKSDIKLPLPTENQHVFIKSENGRCKGGWSKLANTCYIFVSAGAPWEKAKIKCRKFGGTLAHASDEGLNNFLKNMARVHGVSVWIGGFQRQGAWRWDGSNKTMNFFNWSNGNPSGTNLCIQLWSWNNWRWDDSSCGTTKSFICEKPF